MKRIIFLVLMLLGSLMAAPYETTVYSDVDAAGYGGFARMGRRIHFSTNNTIYVLYNEDVNVTPEYSYSTNGGSSWSRQTGWTPAEANFKPAGFIGWIYGDTLYGLYSGTNLGLRIAKIYLGTRIIACDSVKNFRGNSSTGNRSVPNRRLGNGSADDSLIIVNIDSSQWKAYAYTSNGRLTQDVAWTEDPDSIQFLNASVFTFPIYYGIGLFNVNVQDLYYHDGHKPDTISLSIMPAVDGAAPLDAMNTSVLARAPTDSVLYMAFQIARRLYFYRGYINTVSKDWTRTDSVVIADTNGTPNVLNGIRALRYPTLSKLGNKLFYFYKLWPDSSVKDNCAIMYKTSTDEGATWSSAVQFRAPTGSDVILMLTAPPSMNDDSYDVIGVAWADDNAAGGVLKFRGDTTQAAGPTGILTPVYK